MKSSFNPPQKIFIANSLIPNSGKGVFASSDIKKGEVIEVAPILVLEFSDFVETRWNLLFEYYFWLDEFVILALGYGSLYNHIKEANAEYKIDRKNQLITFTSTKDIKKGEEIYINYNPNSTNKAPLWFEREK